MDYALDATHGLFDHEDSEWSERVGPTSVRLDVVSSDDAERRCHMRVHESGHAIVGQSLGLTIGPPTANYQGSVPASVPNDMTDYQRAIALAMFYAAGVAAEREMLGSVHPDFGKKDLANVEALKAEHPRWAADIDAAVAAADEAVRTHQDAIGKLTKRLGTLPRVQLDELTRVHLGGVPVERPPADRSEPS